MTAAVPDDVRTGSDLLASRGANGFADGPARTCQHAPTPTSTRGRTDQYESPLPRSCGRSGTASVVLLSTCFAGCVAVPVYDLDSSLDARACGHEDAEPSRDTPGPLGQERAERASRTAW